MVTGEVLNDVIVLHLGVVAYPQLSLADTQTEPDV